MIKNNTWEKDFIYQENFEYRIDKMLSFININELKSIMDLGCGLQTLKKKLNSNIEYIGIDQYKHIDSSIILDFNNGEFYNKKVDIIFCSGILEYIYDIDTFIRNISMNTEIVIFSYHFIEDISIEKRNKIWVNSYNKNDLISIFNKYGYRNIILMSHFKYFTDEQINNSDSICILSKFPYNMNLINFNKINQIKMIEYSITLQNNINIMEVKLDKINSQIENISNILTWWIPFKKIRENFRKKIKN